MYAIYMYPDERKWEPASVFCGFFDWCHILDAILSHKELGWENESDVRNAYDGMDLYYLNTLLLTGRVDDVEINEWR